MDLIQHLTDQAKIASRNLFAASHVNAAHSALIEAAIKHQPPAFPLAAPLPGFSASKEYLERLARTLDEVAFRVAEEADGNAPGNIDYKGRQSIFTDALKESGLIADLIEASETITENA